MNYLTKPSIYAHIFNGLLMLLAVVLLYRNYKNIVSLRPYEHLVLVLLFSITVGVHSLSHLGLESVYNFNPLE